MKFLTRSLLLAIGLLFLSHTQTVFAEDSKTPLKTLELQDGDSIVFLGDSITHQCLYTQYVEDYFYTRFPKMRLKFHNSGVGGAKAWDALERFDRDVADYKPKYVTVLLGMNDGRYQPFNQEIFDTYHTDMTKLIGRLKEIGTTPILMTPTMFDSRAARNGKRKHDSGKLELYNSVLAYYGTWLRDVAVESGFGFVDMYGPLNNITLQERKANADFTIIRDSVHPDAPGQVVMAFAILNDMGLKKQVSNIRISKAAGNKAVAIVTGGEISDAVFQEDGLTFTFLAESLPLVMPEEAQLGAKLTKLGHKMSREALEVHGLAAGRYELSIDGTVVGVFPVSSLERHIELQENSKTPQHQQAAAVAALNKQRNDGPVKSMRNEWRVFQGYSRLKAQLVASADAEKLKQQVSGLAKRLDGLDDRIKEHEAAALKLEDQIFEINQPKARKYELKRVAKPAPKKKK